MGRTIPATPVRRLFPVQGFLSHESDCAPVDHAGVVTTIPPPPHKVHQWSQGIAGSVNTGAIATGMPDDPRHDGLQSTLYLTTREGYSPDPGRNPGTFRNYPGTRTSRHPFILQDPAQPSTYRPGPRTSPGSGRCPVKASRARHSR